MPCVSEAYETVLMLPVTWYPALKLQNFAWEDAFAAWTNFCGIDIFPSPKSNEDEKQEKGLRRKLQCFATIFGRKFVRSFSSGWLFFV